MQNLQNLITDLHFLQKHMQFQKINQLNQSPHEGDIADLKSTLSSEFFVTEGRLQRESEIPVPRSGFVSHRKIHNGCSISEITS